MTFQTELGYAGKYANYRPGALNLHRITNNLFGLPSRQAFPPSAVVVQQKKIPDFSFWQGVVNFDALRSKTDAAIFRAGQNTWVDTQFLRNWSEAKKRGIKRGSYWFYDDRVSPGKQADLWASLLKDDLPEMEIWADWENSYGGSFGGLQNVVAFMQAMEARLPGIKIGLYSGYYWFRGNSNAVTNASQYNYLKTRPLWLAWYTSNAANVLIPNPYTSLFLWQFGTPAVGHEYGAGSVELDMNYINMTEQQFQQRYGGVVQPPPPPTGESMYYKATGNITIRTGPGATYPNAQVNGVNQFVLTGDILEAVASGGWARISKITRGGVDVTLPPVSYCGTAYLQETTAPPPPTSSEYILHVKDGVTRKFIPE